MTIKRAEGLLRGIPALRDYPDYYLIEVGFGFGLFAKAGSKHSGAAFGTFYPPGLYLYGAKNFERYGGLSWQKNHSQHTRRRISKGKKGLAK